MERFRAIFQGVEDPRKSNAKKHGLNEMLVIALLATLSGWSSCSSFARYARVKYEFLSEFLELKGGPPSHDSFSDVFNALDPEQMAAALTEFAKTLLAALPSGPADQVAIDGKVLKGAILDASSKSALHLVQAFEPGAGLVLGQVKVNTPPRVHPIFFGYAAAARQAFHSRKSGQRMFSRQHLMASRALAPAFDQWHPAFLNRLPTICLQALSTTPDPTGSPRIR